MNPDYYLIPIAFVICGTGAFVLALLFWWLEKRDD